MAKQTLKNKPKAGMKLHKFIALGGNPKNFKGALPNAVANRKKK